MAKFMMLGKYSPESIRGASPGRTKEAVRLIEECKGEVDSMYALLGEYDLAFIAEFPGAAEAMKASLSLSRETGIAYFTHAALPVTEFDDWLS